MAFKESTETWSDMEELTEESSIKVTFGNGNSFLNDIKNVEVNFETNGDTFSDRNVSIKVDNKSVTITFKRC